MKRLLFFVFIFLIVVGMSQVAGAGPVQHVYTGSVTDVDPLLSASFAIGDTMTISYTFESTTADGDPTDTEFGQYLNAITSYTVQVGSYTASATTGDIFIFDRVTSDRYEASTVSLTGDDVNTFPVERGLVVLVYTGGVGSPINNDFLPTMPYNPQDFDFSFLSLSFRVDGTTASVFAANPNVVSEIAIVPFDIKPQSCPNPLNTKSRGLLPVAILSTPDFDAAQVDVSTVQLEGATVVHAELEDVATFFNGVLNDDCLDCTQDGPDGLTDLKLKFDTQEILAAIGPVIDGQCLTLTITGDLLDGTPFEGSDLVVIRQKGNQ